MPQRITKIHLLAAVVSVASLALFAAASVVVGAQSKPSDGPRYTNGTELIFPDNYREWTFLSTGLSMTYEKEGDGADLELRRFQNVFVNPSSYRYFKEHGTWPDGTIFILEIRAAATEASINQAGRFQTDLVALEAEVKDSRFPDGWAFFNFGRAGEMPERTAPLSGDAVAGCVECHTEHTAVERTFVQFYPTLLDIARDKGTLKPGFK